MGIISRSRSAVATREAGVSIRAGFVGGNLNCRKISLGVSIVVSYVVIPVVNIISPAGSNFDMILNII
jgi:hypothetical protein